MSNISRSRGELGASREPAAVLVNSLREPSRSWMRGMRMAFASKSTSSQCRLSCSEGHVPARNGKARRRPCRGRRSRRRAGWRPGPRSERPCAPCRACAEARSASRAAGTRSSAASASAAFRIIMALFAARTDTSSVSSRRHFGMRRAVSSRAFSTPRRAIAAALGLAPPPERIIARRASDEGRGPTRAVQRSLLKVIEKIVLRPPKAAARRSCGIVSV
jgi:hypothetical protein